MPPVHIRDRIIKISNGLYFLLNAFLVWLFWNWPFGTLETHYVWPLYGMIFCIAAFLVALWRRRPGGYALMAGGLLLGLALRANPRDLPAVTRLVSTGIFSAPPVALGFYFARTKQTA